MNIERPKAGRRCVQTLIYVCKEVGRGRGGGGGGGGRKAEEEHSRRGVLANLPLPPPLNVLKLEMARKTNMLVLFSGYDIF